MGKLYVCPACGVVRIGRDEGCDVVIRSRNVSRNHMIISYHDEHFCRIAVNGVNGISVNDARYEKSSILEAGFTAYICFCRVCIIWLGRFIFITSKGVDFDSGLSEVKIQEYPENVAEDYALRHRDFKPTVRMKRNFEPFDIEIEGPPERRVPEKMSLALAAGPALFMALPVLMGFGRKVSMVTSVAAALWAVANVISRQRRVKNDERRRRVAYSAYICECEEVLAEKCKEYRKYMEAAHPDLHEYFRAGGNPSLIWNRSPSDEEYYVYKIGTGIGSFPGKISIPKERFSKLYDSLRDMPSVVQRKYEVLEDITTCLDFSKTMIMGVVYKDDCDLPDVINSLLLRILVSRPPNGLSIILKLGDEGLREHFKWLGFFGCFVDVGEIESTGFDCIVLTDDVSCAGTYGLLKNVRVFIFDKNEDNLPASVDTIITRTSIAENIKSDTRLTKVKYDRVSSIVAYEYARMLAALTVNYSHDDSKIPKMAEFGCLYRDFSLDEHSILDYWNKCDIRNSMAIPVGIGSVGKVTYLDIHEAHDGPHGIIAGTTGSGKSELLSTIILGAQILYPPDKIGLFLIDYKGGSLSNLFSNSPHLMGSVSNLSGRIVRRARISLSSENIRRQAIFQTVGVNNINEYTKGYDEGIFTEALPHILIIIDEFAQLKKEEPEFMQELISIAAVGRSLGIHLIMATQKPAGVVDEKIRSNSRFRIALRVEDRNDSVDMLGRKDASDIKNAGRAYLQVGNDERYELFQSGYTLATVGESTDDRILIFDENMQPVYVNREGGDKKGVKREKAGLKDDESNNKSNNISWLKYVGEEVIKAYKSYEKRNATIHRLWMPPLAKNINMTMDDQKGIVTEISGDYIESDGLIAIADSPETQSYIGIEYKTEKMGNVSIIGDHFSGKSFAISTILTSLIERSSGNIPGVNASIYIVDCGGGKLRVFEKSNRCGGYISIDNKERVPFMMQYLKAKLQSARMMQSIDNEGDKISDLSILVIDNYGEATQEGGEVAEAVIMDILKYGKRYGFYLVITSNRVDANELPSKIQNAMDTSIVLGQYDSFAAASILGARVGEVMLTDDFPGRGQMKVGATLCEMQIIGCEYELITGVIKKDNDSMPRRIPSYPYVPYDLSFEYFLNRLNSQGEYDGHMHYEVPRDTPACEQLFPCRLPVGYESDSGRIYSVPLEKINCVLLSIRRGSDCRLFMSLVEKVSERIGIRVLRISGFEDLFNINVTERTKQIIIIDNLESFLSEFYRGSFTVEQEETLLKFLTNHIINPFVTVFATVEETIRTSSIKRDVLDRVFSNPYAIILGGGLQDNRLFDLSYIPYMKLTKKRKAGEGLVLRYDEEVFYGDVILPHL